MTGGGGVCGSLGGGCEGEKGAADSPAAARQRREGEDTW